LHGFRVLEASGGFTEIPMLALKFFAAMLQSLILRADQPLDTHLVHFGGCHWGWDQGEKQQGRAGDVFAHWVIS
jgi:hypothetical protein